MLGLWEWNLDFDSYLLLVLFLWGLMLAIGANRGWRWLVDPPPQFWPIYFLSFVKRFFGPGAVRLLVYVIGFSIMLVVLQVLTLRRMAGK